MQCDFEKSLHLDPRAQRNVEVSVNSSGSVQQQVVDVVDIPVALKDVMTGRLQCGSVTLFTSSPHRVEGVREGRCLHEIPLEALITEAGRLYGVRFQCGEHCTRYRLLHCGKDLLGQWRSARNRVATVRIPCTGVTLHIGSLL